MKQFRGLILAGAHKFQDEFMPQLRLLELPFQASVRDLRSQVVREACVTIAYLAQELRNKFDHFAESLLPPLINLIPNSAKVKLGRNTNLYDRK
jgi:CLIP-associating protein 1/2